MRSRGRDWKHWLLRCLPFCQCTICIHYVSYQASACVYHKFLAFMASKEVLNQIFWKTRNCWHLPN
jgi:hypothetical protein